MGVVRSLFDILCAERASGRVSTLRDWLAQHPSPDRRFTLTSAGIPDRVRDGVPFIHVVREFLDECFRAPGDRPPRGDRSAARPARRSASGCIPGALAEHLSIAHELVRPSWAARPERFCDRFWLASDVKGFRALLIATSPAAFRRRGLFVSPRALIRV